VIGDGHGRHTQILGPGKQVFDSDGAVQEAVFGMDVKMNKFGHLMILLVVEG
jgi:hypothetical protein